MKIHITFLFAILIFISASCQEQVTVEDLKRFVAIESYPEDVFLDTVTSKKALIIIAHDDDDCAMSGTIARLTANGWAIKQVSLQQHKNSKTGKSPAQIICQENGLLLEDGLYRIGLDTMKQPYLPIPYDEIKRQFLTQKVADAIIEKVDTFNPSVIFTLDNIKGGYGHPEHIFISQLVLDLYMENRISVERIYQSVYTDHMETEIVDKWLKARLEKWGYPSASDIANKMYGIDGMPDPDVQVSISGFGQIKMNYLMAYDEDVRKNLRKFIPYYEEFDAQTYFSIFNKEYFRVIQ